MKLLMVSRALPFHGAGGMESVAWDLARALAARGVEVAVLTTAATGLADGEVIEGVTLRTVAADHRRYDKAWWTGSLALFQREYGDVDVVLGVSAAANAVAGGRRPGAGPRFVFQAHGTSSGEIVSKFRSGSLKSIAGSARNLYWGVFKDRAYRDYDAVVAVGKPVLGQLTRLPTSLLVGRTPVNLILNGVDTAIFAFDSAARAEVRTRLGIAPDARVALSLSRLHPQKGLMQALAGFALAREQDAGLVWVVAGEGPLRPELEARVSAMGLAPVVRFAGAVARVDVPAYLAAADALLFPTLRVEGLPISVLEALAAGLPMITAPWGADADLPVERVEPTDAPALARELLAAPISADRRPSRLPAAYTLDHMVNAYLTLFERLSAGAP